MKVRNAWPLAVVATGLALVLSCASTDVGITTNVKSKFVADDVVKAAQIEVTTSGGVVTLTGNVDNEATKARALELAKATAGVVKVVDMISAREASGGGDAPDPSRTVGEVVTDAGITMSVKGKLLDDPQVKGLKIDVDTREGVVYLTGTVGSDVEKDKAIQLAKDVKGVQEVKANLTIGKS